jgi:hypothetical protein
MKNPFSNETVKSAAIVIGSAAAFIAISKGISVIRKKLGDNPKMKAIFGSAENAGRGSKCLNLNENRNGLASGAWARRLETTDCTGKGTDCGDDASCEPAN